jgi:hypothetical protein
MPAIECQKGGAATEGEVVERPRYSAEGGIGESSALWGGCTARPGPIGVDFDS